MATTNNIYTVLPLDEPTFDINTNTRKITVPAEFAKNGISVQGDEISEILYFSVDRYADSMDLARKDINIAIQWETAPDGKGQTVKGISKEWIRDITSLRQEGKVLFGWAINSELTKNPGAIKFSVRFYHFDENQKLDFSLNTLTASAVIHPSIDYRFDEEGQSSVQIIDSSNLIMNRLKDSETPSGTKPAAIPYFIINFPTTPEEGVFTTTEDGEEYPSVDLKIGQWNEELKAYDPNYFDFKVQATSDDGGVISYEWYRKPLGQMNEDALDNNGAKIVYEPTEDDVYKREYPYYKEIVINEETGEKGYTPAQIPSDLMDTAIDPEDKKLLFERRAVFTAHHTGDYRVIAVNRNGVARAECDSFKIRIPGPDVESFELTYPEGQEQSYLAGEDAGEVTLEITGKTEQDGDKVSYAWFNVTDGVNVLEKPEILDINETSSIKIGPIAAEARPTFNKTYIVSSQVSRNGDSSDIVRKEFRVTDKAHPVTLRTIGDRIRVEADKEGQIAVETIVNVVTDNIEYQWYQFTKNDSDEDIMIPGATSETIKFAINPDVAAEKGIFNLGSGSYYCKAINHVNGSTAVSESGLIDIIQY